MKFTASVWKILFGIGTLLFIVLLVVSGRSKFLADLVTRRKLKQLDKEDQTAKADLERLQREDSNAKETIEAARKKAADAARAVAEAEEAVRQVPPHQRAADFNDWYDSRHSSTDKSGSQ